MRRNISIKSIMPGGALQVRAATDSKACLHVAGSHLDGHEKRPLRERRRPVPYWEGQGQQEASLSFLYGPTLALTALTAVYHLNLLPRRAALVEGVLVVLMV